MISKNLLTSTIAKYYINGLNNQVKWRVKDNTLTIYAGEAGRVCKVELNNFPLEDSELGVFDTNKLSKLISITNGDLVLSLEKIKAVYLGTYFGDIDSLLKESALSYAKFKNIFTNSKIVLIFLIVISSIIYALKKIKSNNKARDDVEIILKGLLFVSSLIAILTTLGIIFSLLYAA